MQRRRERARPDTVVPSDPPTAPPVGDSREAGQRGDGPCCDYSAELARSSDGLPQTRSSGDAYWRGQGRSGGKRAGEPGTDVPSDPPTATPAAGSREGDGDEEEGWWEREGSWDDDAILEEWDSVKLDGGFVEIQETEFFLAQVEGEDLDPEGQSLMWDRRILLRDLRGDVYEVPVES